MMQMGNVKKSVVQVLCKTDKAKKQSFDFQMIASLRESREWDSNPRPFRYE